MNCPMPVENRHYYYGLNERKKCNENFNQRPPAKTDFIFTFLLLVKSIKKNNFF